MKHDQTLINFMQKCLQYEDIVLTWGIKRIQVSDIAISFIVSGFNFSGEIIVTLGEDKKTLLLYSSLEYIGSTNNTMDALKLLDNYIESNEDKYLKLLDSLIK